MVFNFRKSGRESLSESDRKRREKESRTFRSDPVPPGPFGIPEFPDTVPSVFDEGQWFSDTVPSVFEGAPLSRVTVSAANKQDDAKASRKQWGDSPEDIIRRQKSTIDLLTSGISNNQSDIGRLKARLEILERDATLRKALVEGHARVTRMISAMSMLVWGILGWAGVLLASQASPDSSLQSAASSVVKKFSGTETAFDRIKGGEYALEALKAEKRHNEDLRKVIAAQEEMTSLQKKVIARYAERLSSVDPVGYRNVRTSVKPLAITLPPIAKVPDGTSAAVGSPTDSPTSVVAKPSAEKLAPVIVTTPVAKRIWDDRKDQHASAKSLPTIPQKTVSTASGEKGMKKITPAVSPDAQKPVRLIPAEETERIYRTVSKIRDAILPEFADLGVSIKIQEHTGWRILVWTVVDGRKSMAYYAGTPRHSHRLTEEGMRQWVRDSVEQVFLATKVETMAKMRGIGSSAEGSVSMKVKKLPNGDVDVTISDTFSGKAEQFRVGKRIEEASVIGSMIDAALSKLTE